jgi:hypothetical protein
MEVVRGVELVAGTVQSMASELYSLFKIFSCFLQHYSTNI